jgi:hypothetical protein
VFTMANPHRGLRTALARGRGREKAAPDIRVSR